MLKMFTNKFLLYHLLLLAKLVSFADKKIFKYETYALQKQRSNVDTCERNI